MNPYAFAVVNTALEVATLIATHRDMLDDLPDGKKIGLHDCVKVVTELLQRADELLGQMESSDPTDIPPELKKMVNALTEAIKKGGLPDA